MSIWHLSGCVPIANLTTDEVVASSLHIPKLACYSQESFSSLYSITLWLEKKKSWNHGS